MVNIWAIVVVAFSSLLKGITGFGFALLSLPLLMIWYSPKELIPVLVMCNLIASIFIILQKKEKKLIDGKSSELIIYGGVFTIFGVITLQALSNSFLIQGISIFFILLCLIPIFQTNTIKSLPNWSYKLAGAFIGFLTGSVSVSGPPLALFLNQAKVPNKMFREIFAWFSVVTSTVAIIGYALTGLLSAFSIKMTLIFTPILLLGAILGKKLNTLLSPNVFRKISLVITLVSCLLLLMF